VIEKLFAKICDVAPPPGFAARVRELEPIKGSLTLLASAFRYKNVDVVKKTLTAAGFDLRQ
jgi:hypothetical protein